MIGVAFMCLVCEHDEIGAEAPVGRLSLSGIPMREHRAMLRELHPDKPVCAACDFPFCVEDADIFDGRLCVTCGWRRLEKRAVKLVFAKGKKARKRALRRLLALAK